MNSLARKKIRLARGSLDQDHRGQAVMTTLMTMVMAASESVESTCFDAGSGPQRFRMIARSAL